MQDPEARVFVGDALHDLADLNGRTIKFDGPWMVFKEKLVFHQQFQRRD